MRKAATMLLLIIAMGLLFSGAASADPSVEVVVLDENLDEVEVASAGEEVAVGVGVQTDTEIDPYVEIEVDPETGLELDPDNAMMTTDGINWIYNNDPLWGGFFFFDGDVWIWDIYSVVGTMDNGDGAAILIPAMVTETGEITVYADLFAYQEQGPPTFVAEDSYTFLSVPTAEAAGETVPMQPTGAPVALAALGLLGILGGAIYGRLR